MAQGCVRPMGISFDRMACWRKKNRFLFFIGDTGNYPPAVADDGVSALPPLKGARPSLTFKETECQHLNETIYFPSKPDWKPVTLVLYDIRNTNPVFDWIKEVYDPTPQGQSGWKPSRGGNFKKTARLEIYDGCGVLIEKWMYENAWPQVSEWGELDMSNSEVITVDVTLRYDRAYVIPMSGGNNNQGGNPAGGAPNIPSGTSGGPSGFGTGSGSGSPGPGTGGPPNFGPTGGTGGPGSGPGPGGPSFGAGGGNTIITVGGGTTSLGGTGGGTVTIVGGPGGTTTTLGGGTTTAGPGAPAGSPGVSYVTINGNLVPVYNNGLVASPSRSFFPAGPPPVL